MLQRIGFDRAPELQIEAARALSSKGVAQGQLGMPEAAIAIYDEVIERFGTDRTPAIRVQVARALVNKGSMQRQLGDFRIAMRPTMKRLSSFEKAMHCSYRCRSPDHCATRELRWQRSATT